MMVFVQARMSSKRLPGKMSLPFKKYSSLLDAVVNPLSQLSAVTEVVVLTSSSVSDDSIYLNCKERGYQCFRGDLENVYARFVDAVRFYKPKSFARLCGDSPLFSKEIIFSLISEFERNDYLYASNTLERSFPAGLSFEVVDSDAFDSEKFLTSKQHNKEHVTTAFSDPVYEGSRLSLRTSQVFEVSSYAVDTMRDYESLYNLEAPTIDAALFVAERI